ncbi:MAG: hypothetical protein Tsb005_11120 [Gammaproteobacteria bacterium]
MKKYLFTIRHSLNSTSGFTLIELIVFIIAAAILSAGIFIGMDRLLRSPLRPNQITTAQQLARTRMEMILAQRNTVGFGSFIDTCAAGSLSPLCTVPTGYSVSSSITPLNVLGDSNYRQIVVTVTGLSPAELTMVVGDF